MITFNITAMEDEGCFYIDNVLLNDKVLTKLNEETNKTDLSMIKEHIGQETELVYSNGTKIKAKIKDVRFENNGYVVYFR